MSASPYLKCRCQHCRGRIEFPIEGVGTAVACPHCGVETDLTLPIHDGDVEPAERRARAWAIGGVIVLVLLLVAAFVAVHLLQNIAPRVRQTRAISSGQRATMKPAAAATISSATATTGEIIDTAGWLRTNGLAISSIDLDPQPGTALTYVTGTVVNLLPRQRVGVVVDLQLLDANGNGLGKIRAHRALLEPSARWDLRAAVPNPESKSARITAVREGP